MSSYSTEEYKVSFKFKSRIESSKKYFQTDRELDIYSLFKKAMTIDGYSLDLIEDVHIYRYDRFKKSWESRDDLLTN